MRMPMCSIWVMIPQLIRNTSLVTIIPKTGLIIKCLHNPNFAEFAKLCGGQGFRATKIDEVAGAIEAGLNADGPSIVEILTDPSQT